MEEVLNKMGPLSAPEFAFIDNLIRLTPDIKISTILECLAKSRRAASETLQPKVTSKKGSASGSKVQPAAAAASSSGQAASSSKKTVGTAAKDPAASGSVRAADQGASPPGVRTRSGQKGKPQKKEPNKDARGNGCPFFGSKPPL